MTGKTQDLPAVRPHGDGVAVDAAEVMLSDAAVHDHAGVDVVLRQHFAFGRQEANSRPFSTPNSTSTSRKLRLKASLTAAANCVKPSPLRALIGMAFGIAVHQPVQTENGRAANRSC